MPLTRQQDEARQIAERIDKRDDFGRQTAARSPDCLILSPPLAPSAMLVDPDDRAVDRGAYSKSGSSDNALKRDLENTLRRPAAKAPEDRNQPPKFRMQIPTRLAGAGNPKNSFDKAAVIMAATTRIDGLARNQRRNPLHCPSLKIRQIKARLLISSLESNSPKMP